MKKHTIIAASWILLCSLIYPNFLEGLNFKYNWPFFTFLLIGILYLIYQLRKSMLRRSVTVVDSGLYIESIGMLSFKSLRHIDVNSSKPNIIITLKNKQQLQLTPINGYSKSAKNSFYKFLESLEKATAANMA